MMAGQFLVSLQESHRDCCLTSHCQDENCGVDLSGINLDSLVILHGENHRDAHGDRRTQMADRILFTDRQGLVVAVIELKGGTSDPTHEAVGQIRMGMKAAENLLEGCQVANWYPLLIFSGPRRPKPVRYLQFQSNRIEFRGELKTIVWRDCGSNLDAILNELSPRS